MRYEGFRRLAEEWREEAETLRWRGQKRAAVQAESYAKDLEDRIEKYRTEVLTPQEASELSGYCIDHLRRLVRNGTIPNAGEEGGPRIRRCDLPRKPGHRAAHTDGPPGNDPVPSRTQMARSVVESEQGDDDGER